MTRMRFLIAVFIGLLPCLAFSSFDVGETPYAMVGKNGTGDVLNLNDFKGKVVIVTFWATWCGPCMREIPVLSGIQKRAGTEHLQVIAIGYHEPRATFKKVSRALADNPIIFSFDTKGRAADKYGVKSIPNMIIIGRDGTVKGTHVGYSEQQLPQLVDEINNLLLEESGETSPPTDV